MSTEQEIEILEKELKANHIERIRTTGGFGYFELLQREVEIKKRLAQLQPEPPAEKEPGHTLWSEKEVAQLRLLYADHTVKDIAAKLNRTYYAVESKVQLLGLRKK